ncbi:uncharacterized protein LOC118735168 isoform X2 [Rhagoletis pomonella]|uniref:uncharacterized protein LOC118735168 isoform X2 n=1 Tax=Rhagoletis pomonella TaxID=28610 RepID=UPI001786C307|nr:uncharacterized protein LOC118735168 isoform X2 [Rhagoletis pomonella]
MHNTSRNRQSQPPCNTQNRRKISTVVSNSKSSSEIFNNPPLYATSSWLLPPTTSNTLEYRRLSQESPHASIHTNAEAVKKIATSTSAPTTEACDASSTSPSLSTVDSFLLRGWSPVPTTSTDTSHWFAKMSRRNVSRKRKRQVSVNATRETKSS